MRRNDAHICDGQLNSCTLAPLSAPDLQEPRKPRHDTTSPSERKRLLSLAYGYLGSLVDGEDIVQEALLRFEQADRTSIKNVAAWLTTVVTHLSLDKLRSAQHRREVYPGEWLPEPIFEAPTPEQYAITRSRLSVGLLYLLEKLEPEQRVVFVLREVFEHHYQSIAEITGKSEAACRQLMARARAALDRAKQSPPVPRAIASSIVSRFINALLSGDEKELLESLQKTLCWWGMAAGKCLRFATRCMGLIASRGFFWACETKMAATCNTAGHR